MDPTLARRGFLSRLSAGLAIPALAGGSSCGRSTVFAKTSARATEQERDKQEQSQLAGPVSVVTPGIETLPFELDGAIKVFRLRAEPVTIRFQDMSDSTGARRRPIEAWGYNGSVIGPTIEITEGDRVRIHVENGLPDPTTVHWHGLHVPIGMDGVAGISQEPIPPGESFTYEFTVNQHGTYFYHPHFMGAKQVGMGMAGFFIVHPRNPTPDQLVDRDYAYFLQVWMIHPGSPQPDTLEMNNFNYFSMNGKPAPSIVPMSAKIGEKVRIRVANLSMLTHPIHLHGHTYRVTEYGAGFLPPAQQIIANTINISSAEVRTLEFVAGPNPGQWVFHCHFMHHTMNDMHRTPIPGSGGGGHSGHDAGGMHTWIDVTET
jgi:FtsP/CotA-like multicopper oxidase with cupredoxin domain